LRFLSGKQGDSAPPATGGGKPPNGSALCRGYENTEFGVHGDDRSDQRRPCDRFTSAGSITADVRDNYGNSHAPMLSQS